MAKTATVEAPPISVALSAQTDRPTEILNEPVTYADKDAIRCGIFKVPQDQGEPITLSVDKNRLNHWADQINKFVALGINIPIVASEIHQETTRNNVGRIVGAKVSGDRLITKLSLIGDDARRMAARNEVSVMILPTFTDGEGRVWKDAITHLALTPSPVVTDLGVPIAASLAAGERPILLSYFGDSMNGDPMPAATGDTTMLPCSGMCMSELHKSVPGLADVAPAGKMDHILGHIKKTGGMSDGISGAAPVDGAGMSLSMTEHANRVKSSWEVTAKLSNQLAAARQPEVREAAVSLVSARRELCVQKGALSQATADKLYAAIVGTEAQPNFVALSRASTIDGGKSLALSIFQILEENEPKNVGQQTTVQRDVNSLALSNTQKTPEHWNALSDAFLNLGSSGATKKVM